MTTLDILAATPDRITWNDYAPAIAVALGFLTLMTGLSKALGMIPHTAAEKIAKASEASTGIASGLIILFAYRSMKDTSLSGEAARIALQEVRDNPYNQMRQWLAGAYGYWTISMIVIGVIAAGGSLINTFVRSRKSSGPTPENEDRQQRNRPSMSGYASQRVSPEPSSRHGSSSPQASHVADTGPRTHDRSTGTVREPDGKSIRHRRNVRCFFTTSALNTTPCSLYSTRIESPKLYAEATFKTCPSNQI